MGTLKNERVTPDSVLTDIASYVMDYTVKSQQAIDSARLCVTDSLACAFDALQLPECARLVGPLVPGTLVPDGARVPGTRFELDPATAAFGLGSMIRWSDFNDAFTAATGGHPSDNLAGVLMMADHLSRKRVRAGTQPLVMRDVLEALVKAYEIQGCIAIENDFFHNGMDHNLLVRVATAAVLTRMLGGTRDQVVNAVSNAWIDSSLVTYRYAPNTGPRKNWACADASAAAVRLAMMALRGESGYPAVLTAKNFGFFDARFGGKPLKFQQRYGEYVIQHSMFKFVPAGMHSQSAVECAFRLHPRVNKRIDDIERVDLHSHAPLIDIMDKTGPLHNADDRDHCAQYVVAVGLLYGRLGAHELTDQFAADPRIDLLRRKIFITEDPRYTRDFYDPAKRSSANSIEVQFKDGSQTEKAEENYPIGHVRRRQEAEPVLRRKLERSLRNVFSPERCDRILKICTSGPAFDAMPVHSFVEALIPDHQN